jgi:hypothetical protein
MMQHLLFQRAVVASADTDIDIALSRVSVFRIAVAATFLDLFYHRGPESRSIKSLSQIEFQQCGETFALDAFHSSWWTLALCSALPAKRPLPRRCHIGGTGEEDVAYCVNPGRMGTFTREGARIWLLPAKVANAGNVGEKGRAKRRLRWS